MKIARSIAEARGAGPTAVAIGVFDGVHAGHQELLRRTREAAAELGAKAAVLTFHPHPACVVAPERAPRLLYSIEERCELLAVQGVEIVLVLPFTDAIATMPPEQFAASILRETLDARAVLVGDNFRFGCARAGDIGTLADMGFDTRPLPSVTRRGRVVSSSEIRRLLEGGEVTQAGRMLGRFYAIAGDIVPGHGIGAKQTVPTLNLRPQAELLPANGVYITRTTDLESGTRWKSITNVGVRPTFANEGGVSVETFLLEPLTHPAPERIRLEFLRHVREERKFASPEELKAQILRDVSTAKSFFRRLHW